MQGVIGRIFLSVFVLGVVALPGVSHAQVANVVFTSDAQSIGTGVVSGQLTLQAQDSAGASVNIPQTACLSLMSTSPQGQFSSSATNWSPVTVLTMNKGTANKNFYYQDAQAGTPTITVKAALKPASVTSSCANWPLDQWGTLWNATQSITIGNGAASNDAGSSGSPSDSTSTAQTQTQTQNIPPPASSYVAPPAPSLFADAGADRTVIVGADVQFDARAYDTSRAVLDAATVRFMWNFGDGSTAEGRSVLHHYEYPGRYALVLNIAQDRFAGVDEAVITAEPAKLGFSALQDGGVEIQNLAGRDLDLSGWLVRAGAGLLPALFTLPPRSLILSGSSMRIGKETLGFAATSQARLQYPNGVLALEAGETTPSAGVTPPVPAPAPAPVTVAPASRTRSSAVPPSGGIVPTVPEDAPVPDATGTASTEVAAAGASVPSSSNMWWIAAGLAIAAGGSLVAARRFGKKEWDIVEEK